MERVLFHLFSLLITGLGIELSRALLGEVAAPLGMECCLPIILKVSLATLGLWLKIKTLYIRCIDNRYMLETSVQKQSNSFLFPKDKF